jgi:hypothetical protein
MNVDGCRHRLMCLYGVGVRCRAVVGHGSDGRPRHGLRVKSTLESERSLSRICFESDFFGAKN